MINGETNNGVSFVSARMNLAFNYAAGEAASRFLIALRDEKKIYGTRCPSCLRLLVPARSFCPRCFIDTTEWIEVGPVGTLVAFAFDQSLQSHARASQEYADPNKRLCLGLIRFEGADTSLVHRIGEVNPDTLRVGVLVAPVFIETRSGNILDIAYFKPVEADNANSI